MNCHLRISTFRTLAWGYDVAVKVGSLGGGKGCSDKITTSSSWGCRHSLLHKGIAL